MASARRYRSHRSLGAGRALYRSARGCRDGILAFLSRRGLSAGRATYLSARGCRDGVLAFASRRRFFSLADEGTTAPLLWPTAFGWPVGILGVGYRFVAAGGVAMAADPVAPTTRATTLRSGDALVPFALDFSPDLSSTDTIDSATVTVWAAPTATERERDDAAPTETDVTTALLRSVVIAGTSVVATLGQANARVGTRYSVRIVAHLGSGESLQESIEGVECDQ